MSSTEATTDEGRTNRATGTGAAVTSAPGTGETEELGGHRMEVTDTEEGTFARPMSATPDSPAAAQPRGWVGRLSVSGGRPGPVAPRPALMIKLLPPVGSAPP